MTFTRGGSVEFLVSVSCRVFATSGGGVVDGSVRVKSGTVGSVYPNERGYACLPGHVLVVVFDESRDRNIAVDTPEGCIAAMRVEKDPRTGMPVRRVYRNVVIDIDVKSMV